MSFGGGDYSTSSDHLLESQKLACQVLLRISSSLSIGGSGYILYDLFFRQPTAELKKRLFSRLLVGLSISDVVSSAFLFCGDWPVPADSLHSDILYGNRGTQLTCNIQGFALQFAYFSSIFYTAGLSLNFLFSVKYGWKEEDLKSRLEPYIHGIAVLVPFSLATSAWVFDMMNPSALFCYVNVYPIVSISTWSCLQMLLPGIQFRFFLQGCEKFDQVDCIRGKNSWMWRTIVQIIPFAVCFSVICVSMILIYRVVRRLEENVSRYSREFALNERKNSKLAFRKATSYIGVFMAVWIPVLTVGLCQDLGVRVPASIWFVDCTMLPIQGLLNALVYSGMVRRIKRSLVELSRSLHRHSNGQFWGAGRNTSLWNSGGIVRLSETRDVGQVASRVGGGRIDRSSSSFELDHQSQTSSAKERKENIEKAGNVDDEDQPDRALKVTENIDQGELQRQVR